MSRCSDRCAPPHAPDGWSSEAQRHHPTYRHYVDAPGIQCELEHDHDGGPGKTPRLHRNGGLTWWNPPLLIVGGVVVDGELEETEVGAPPAGAALSAVAAVRPPAGDGSVSSSSQLTELPGSTFEDIFRKGAV